MRRCREDRLTPEHAEAVSSAADANAWFPTAWLRLTHAGRARVLLFPLLDCPCPRARFPAH